MKNEKQIRRTGSGGFTLVEIMLVVAIIGLLASLVFPRVNGSGERAREIRTQADIYGGIKTALDHYEVDNGSFPKSLQGLLQQPSEANNWRGPYLDPAQFPLDAWKNPYYYQFPGKHNPSSYDLWTAGPDGKSGTADDIGNWMLAK
jgi:general secretion pathway protein G